MECRRSTIYDGELGRVQCFDRRGRFWKRVIEFTLLEVANAAAAAAGDNSTANESGGRILRLENQVGIGRKWMERDGSVHM